MVPFGLMFNRDPYEMLIPACATEFVVKQSIIISGRHYRKPHPISFNEGTFKKMVAISLDLFEKAL
jgi:hypothetical protein